MITLDFTETYSYRALETGDVMPLLPVGLRLTGPHRDVSIDFLLLLDTGASDTLLDGIHLRAAGIDIFSGEPKRFRSFLGASSLAYRHRVTLLLGQTSITADVAFSTQPLLRQILGRDILAEFQVALQEREQLVHLNPAPG